MKILDKDIPDLPILQFIEHCTEGRVNESFEQGGKTVTWAPPYAIKHTGFNHSVAKAFPKFDKTSEQTIHTKMKRLLAAGLIDGCNCGCKGEFTITEKGRKSIAELLAKLADSKSPNSKQ